MGNHHQHSDLLRTARITGVWYLALGVSGMLGFLIFHPLVFVTDDPEKTLENLTERETFARVRISLEFAIVVSQALAAVWFYKLFGGINKWAAWSLGVWGMVNAIVIMVSAIALASALDVAAFANQSLDSKLMLIQLLDKLSKNAWGIGSLFFGLWLIPMGYIVVSSGRMPVWMGRILILGGAGYLLNTFINYMGFTEPWIGILVIPATIGEFWMIGYLLTYGIRNEVVAEA